MLRSRVAEFCLSINKTGVISPRYNVRITDFEKWVVKLLPSRQFGYIVLTTSAGIMDHEEARRKHVAGKIIGYDFSVHNVDDILITPLQFLLLEYGLSWYAADSDIARAGDGSVILKSWGVMEA